MQKHLPKQFCTNFHININHVHFKYIFNVCKQKQIILLQIIIFNAEKSSESATKTGYGRNLANVQRGEGSIPNCLSADVATPTLVSVKVVEIRNDDRNRKCNGEDAGDDAQRADHLAPDADRRDVTVTDGCHGYDGPPERARD